MMSVFCLTCCRPDRDSNTEDDQCSLHGKLLSVSGQTNGHRSTNSVQEEALMIKKDRVNEEKDVKVGAC